MPMRSGAACGPSSSGCRGSSRRPPGRSSAMRTPGRITPGRAIARAARVADDHPKVDAALARARELAPAIAEEEHRELLLGDLATV